MNDYLSVLYIFIIIYSIIRLSVYISHEKELFSSFSFKALPKEPKEEVKCVMRREGAHGKCKMSRK
jgi:hypothetical protein